MDLAEMKSLFINGKYTNGRSTSGFKNLNPATGELIQTIHEASVQDIEDAVESAEEGFKTWSNMSGAQRGRIMMKAVNILRERNNEIAQLEVLDTGKSIQEAAVVDIHSGADAIEYYAGLASSIHGEHIQLENNFAYTRREPLGICAGLGAWNYPIQIACWKSAPALACGNSMIFKPAELSPITALILAEVYHDAGLPNGVFNVIQGDAKVGQALTKHPKIAKVSLTGEVSTGKKVMADAAQTLKHVTMELGGKSPLIIFDDVDLDNAVTGALYANFYNQGEVCSNGTRVFVHKSIEKEFLTKLIKRVRNIKVGDPMNPQTHMGALINREHLQKVLSYIELGKKEGAKLEVGGTTKPEITKDPKFVNGNFVNPTVFSACHDEMRIVKEEIFGPVMSVLSFEQEKEVVDRANNTDYGLAAGVFTNNLQQAHRVIAQLEAGSCWINTFNASPIEIPFGGYKNSGIGRENGLTTINHYTQLKSVFVELGKLECPY
ncbi:MAG: betaine-aldehyde dehydrogenase [Oligoflexales bacterium]